MTKASNETGKGAAKRKSAPTHGKNNIVLLDRGRAQESVRSLTEMARAHPIAAVAGGLALGLIAGSLVKKGAFGKLARNATALAEVATLTGAALGRDAVGKLEEAAEAGKNLGKQAGERASAASSRIRRQGDRLAHGVGDALSPAEEAASNAIEAGHRFLNKAADLVLKARG